MWQLYQEHSYYYLLLYSFCRGTYRISILILLKLLPGYISSVFWNTIDLNIYFSEICKPIIIKSANNQAVYSV